MLTPEQIAAEERRWLFDAPIAELAEGKGVSIDEAVKMRTDAVLQEAVVPITVSAVSYTHLDVYKRQHFWNLPGNQPPITAIR